MVAFVSFFNFFWRFPRAECRVYPGPDDNEAALGTINGAFGIGALIGGIIMGVWGGTRPRIHTIMPGIFGVGIGLALYGLSRSPLTLGVSIFWAPLPMIASFSSILHQSSAGFAGARFVSLSDLQLLYHWRT
jgi:hypothetical protein